MESQGGFSYEELKHTPLPELKLITDTLKKATVKALED